MKKYFTFTLVILTISSVIIACKKNGTGGDATIAAFPQHHGKAIYGATAYIKYKAKDLPDNPTVNYDLKVVGDPKEDHVHIDGMLPGNYYLYAVGYDSAISQTVKGGIALSIKYSEKKSELDINIPVTE